MDRIARTNRNARCPFRSESQATATAVVWHRRRPSSARRRFFHVRSCVKVFNFGRLSGVDDPGRPAANDVYHQSIEWSAVVRRQPAAFAAAVANVVKW